MIPTPREVYVANCIEHAIYSNAGQDVIDAYLDELIMQLRTVSS